MNEENLSPERFFFLYAFPCLKLKLIRNEITEEYFEHYKKIRNEKAGISRDELGKLFPNAIKRMGNNWNPVNVQDYWYIKHNEIIDSKSQGYGDDEGHTDRTRRACKVHFGLVESVDDKVIVNYNNGNHEVENYGEELREGDYVTVHLGCICEKISKELYQNYG